MPSSIDNKPISAIRFDLNSHGSGFTFLNALGLLDRGIVHDYLKP